MKFKNHIQDLPTIELKNSIRDAIQFFEQTKQTCVVVLEDNLYRGLLLEEDLIALENDLLIKQIKDKLKIIYLNEDFTIFDWFKTVSLHDIQDVPLINLNNEYLGSLNINDVILKFSNTGLNVDRSSILILSKNSDDFKYSEVFQILEANAAKVYGSYINHSDESQTEIVVNIHHQGLNELLQSFRRYEYNITSYHEEDQHRETLKNNSEYLSKYLTV
ncbi:CBS domain-containing protein [Flavobacteriaceae bacterium 14752]|uniref:CBS domain-containing protein n=1 Tax=Mesohalobacter salilacus TaxID=2491711 RepID=UPI000F63ECBC